MEEREINDNIVYPRSIRSGDLGVRKECFLSKLSKKQKVVAGVIASAVIVGILLAIVLPLTLRGQ